MGNFFRSIIRASSFFRKEIFEILRQPRLVATLVLGPFFILFIFGIGYRNQSRALRTLSFVRAKTVRTGANSMRIIVDQASTATPELMGWAQQQNIQVQAVEEYMPSFEDVFVELVRPEVSNG